MISFVNNAILLLLLAGCYTGITFNPDFHIGDYERGGITGEDGVTIYADDPQFNQWACLHVTKVEELKTILQKAKIPKRKRHLFLKQLELIKRQSRDLNE